MSDGSGRLTAWDIRYSQEDVQLAQRLYEAWRQAIVDWGVKTPPTWSELCAQGPGDDGVKPWLAAAAAAQPHTMCGRSVTGGALIADHCRTRHRGHTCNRIVHGQNNMHYCSCFYSWPMAMDAAVEPVT